MKKKYVKPSTTVVVMEDVCRFPSFSVIKGNSNGTAKTSDEIIDNGKVYDHDNFSYGNLKDTWFDNSDNWGGD